MWEILLRCVFASALKRVQKKCEMSYKGRGGGIFCIKRYFAEEAEAGARAGAGEGEGAGAREGEGWKSGSWVPLSWWGIVLSISGR